MHDSDSKDEAELQQNSELSSSTAAPSMPPLYAHQQATILRNRSSPILFDTSDPGTGKTRAHAVAFEERRKQGGKCALVLAPKSILRTAWEKDVRSFTSLQTSVAFAENRAEAFAKPADVYVTNTDAVSWLAKQPKSFFGKFDTLIVDESTFFKHHTSARSRALAKIAPLFTYRSLLTGTPNSNGICDVWHQLYVLDEGARLGKSFYAFRGACCTPKQVGPSTNMVQWQDKPGVEASVSGLIADITIRNKLEDCVDIPENYEYAVAYTLPQKLLDAYDALKQDAIIQLSTGKISAANAAVLTRKLLQVASGAVYEADDIYHVLSIDRYEYVLDLVQQRSRSVVFFEWKHERDQLTNLASKRGITYAYIDGSVSTAERTRITNAYQAGFYDTIFLHPQSAAHGITLTAGVSTIWTHPTYNLEHFIQGNRRVYRAGQSKKTETVVVVADETLEPKVFQALTSKNLKMLNLLEMLV
jgi:SNF2 family DNA or RNA helicase